MVFLNHGSFGACPRVVLEVQTELRRELEREPVRFFAHSLEDRLDQVRVALGGLLGANPDDLALVHNATEGVNTILASAPLNAGDEILTTDHTYNACRNAADRAAARAGARVVRVHVPFPLQTPDEVVRAVLDGVTSRTRLALLDHITSPTGLVFPIETLVTRLRERGVDTLVDGAHAPGMVPLNLDELGAAYYTGNCHKWLCAPKGAAFLHVRRDLQDSVFPLSITHGYNSPREDRSRFRLNFDLPATLDPTAWLSVPAAIQFLQTLRRGGLTELMVENKQKALAARALLCKSLGIPAPAPESMIGSLATVPVPNGGATPRSTALTGDPLAFALFSRHRIEVPVWPWPAPPRRILRISAQVYNTPAQYQKLCDALGELLSEARA